jgi:hypothetical protein
MQNAEPVAPEVNVRVSEGAGHAVEKRDQRACDHRHPKPEPHHPHRVQTYCRAAEAVNRGNARELSQQLASEI